MSAPARMRVPIAAALLFLAACTSERQDAPAASVARGAYLANGVARCFWCHSPLDKGNPAYPRPETLGSGDVLDKDAPIIASNLTPDAETGLGNWSDEAIVRAIRNGVGRDGRSLRMHPGSYYSVMTDEDAASVVAYLRSLKPIRRVLPRTARPKDVHESVQPYVEPARSAAQRTPVERGAYLVQLGECLGCHTTTTAEGKPAHDLRYGGGRLFAVADGVGFESSTPIGGAPLVASANITQDPSGISYYTEDVFVKTIRTGRVNGVRPLSAAMPWIFFRNMSDEDLRAIFAYLKTIPPVAHNVVNAEPATPCARCGRLHGGGDANAPR